MTKRAQEAVETVWEFAAYLLTAVLFVLIGLAIDVGGLGTQLSRSSGIVAVVGARALLFYGVVGPANRLLRTPDHRFPTGWLNVMIAAGMRGAVSVALALSLPADIPSALCWSRSHSASSCSRWSSRASRSTRSFIAALVWTGCNAIHRVVLLAAAGQYDRTSPTQGTRPPFANRVILFPQVRIDQLALLFAS